MNKWTKPVVAVTVLIAAGAFTLGLDGIKQVLDPVSPHDGHDTFQLALVSTANGTTVMMQNTITGDLFEVPAPEPVKETEGE